MRRFLFALAVLCVVVSCEKLAEALGWKGVKAGIGGI